MASTLWRGILFGFALLLCLGPAAAAGGRGQQSKAERADFPLAGLPCAQLRALLGADPEWSRHTHSGHAEARPDVRTRVTTSTAAFTCTDLLLIRTWKSLVGLRRQLFGGCVVPKGRA